MGDMADYFNELQEEGGRYFPGGDPYRVRVTQIVKDTFGNCRSCGARFVWRVNAAGKWEPQDGRTGTLARHVCPADDFDDIS